MAFHFNIYLFKIYVYLKYMLFKIYDSAVIFPRYLTPITEIANWNTISV